jgi:hypothetical protein
MLVTSFLPLWVSVLFLLGWDILTLNYLSFDCLLRAKTLECVLAIVIALNAIISIILVLIFIIRKQQPQESSGKGTIRSAQKSSTLVTDFLLTYIMPLIAFNFTQIRDVMLFLLYFALIAFLNIRNSNVYTNILFEFMGYRVYTCDVVRNVAGETYNFADSTVISRDNLTGKIGQEITFFDFDNTIYINLS